MKLSQVTRVEVEEAEGEAEVMTEWGVEGVGEGM